MGATKLRLVELRAKEELDLPLQEQIIEWVAGREPVSKIFEIVRESVPSFDNEAADDLMRLVSELSTTVAALTGMDVMAEVLDAIELQQGDGISAENFEPPDLGSMYGGEEPSVLETIADANLQSAYSRGNQDEDATTDDWWEFVCQPGACDICSPLDGTQAPQDDPIWVDRVAPLHPRCVCENKAIPAQKIRATEHDVSSEWRGVEGWGNPQRKFEPDLSDKPAALLPLYEEKLRRH